MDIRKIVRYNLQRNVIRPIIYRNPLNVLIVDEKATKILSACFTMSEIFKEGLTSIENLSKKREPMPNIDAIYLMSATEENIQRLIEDFTPQRRKKFATYKAAHVFLIDSCSDEIFRQLALSQASKFVRAIKEINLSFIPQKNRIFLTFPNDLASGIASLCSTIGEYPFLRYCSDNREICYQVEQKLDELMKFDKSLGIEKDAELIILDRKFDLLTPLMHDLSLESLISNTFENFDQNGAFTFNLHGKIEKTAIFDESDDFWTEIRHLHVTKALQAISEKAKRLRQENPMNSENKNQNLKTLGKSLQKMPAYQRKIDKLEAYIHLAEQCIQHLTPVFKEICILEQDMATGYTSDGSEIRDAEILQHLARILSTQESPTQIRLLLIYIICQGSVDHLKILEICKISNYEIIFEFLKVLRKNEEFSIRAKNVEIGNMPETCRYEPKLKLLIENVLAGNLSDEEFVIVGRKPRDLKKRRQAQSARFRAVSTSSSSQSSQEGDRKKIVIFVVGED